MPTAAQRERTQMRQVLYTGKHRAADGRGGPVAESQSRDGKPGLIQLWPQYLDAEFAAAKPTLTMPDVRCMIEQVATPRYHNMDSRPLADAEVEVIKAWYDAALSEQTARLGTQLATVQNGIAAQASAHHEQNVDLHLQNARRIDDMRAATGAQIKQLLPQAAKRTIINRHAFARAEMGCYYQSEGGGIARCTDAAPVAGRQYFQLVFVEQQKIDEPHMYYCTDVGPKHINDLHHWSMVVRVKQAEECTKPTLPKRLHAIQGHTAAVINEAGDDLQIQLGAGGKTYSSKRACVEFLHPETAVPAAQGRAPPGISDEELLQEIEAPPKKRRTSKQVAPVLESSVSVDEANRPLTLEGEVLEQINGGLYEGFLDPGLQKELLEYLEEQLRNDEPYAVTMAGPRPFVLKHKKLMFGTLSDGMVPIYNFGLVYEDLRKTKPMPPLLQRVAEQVERAFQQLPNNCVVNIYPSGGDEISPHQDQRFSEGKGRFESKQSVFIIRLGATRPLAMHTLDGQETKEFQLQSGDLYKLTGFVNTHFQHSVPAVENCDLCITLSFRLVFNEMYQSGRFAIINGKKRALERVSPTPTPPPEDVRLERALSVKCPKLGLAMLGGGKVVENRTYNLPLGWHWLYISKSKDLKGLEEFKSQIDTLQYSSAEQDKCYGHVIGGIYIVEVRQPEDCNGYPWAKGPYCHVISHSLTLTQPVLIQKPGAIVVRWTIESEEERQRIRAQIPQGPPQAMDLQEALSERA